MNFKFWQRKNKPNKTANNEQSEYEVKSYSKDGGYIRSPVRSGKNQNSSSFGGMGERELQLKLELLVDQVLSSTNSVFGPAQALVGSSLADQERFLKSVDTLSLIDAMLAFNFCHFAPPSLKVIDEEDWEAWISHLLNIYHTKGMDDCIIAMKRVDDYVDTIAVAPTSVSFDEISRIVESVITGLNGRALKLEQSDQLFTDTEVIHLPENISTFKNREDNFALYKSIAVHQWAQTWFGTWRVDIQQLVSNFADKQKAINLFHKLETVRLDANIKRELPGIGRAIEKFNSLLVASDLSPPWQSAISTLSSEQATAHDTARIVYELYDHDFIPEDTLYQGVLNPELAKQTIDHRIEQDKENLQLTLDELQKESIDNNQDMPVDDEQEGKRFEVREIEDDEMPDGYRFELTLDGEPIEPPDNVQELLESIQQDLGEIPEDYLSPVD